MAQVINSTARPGTKREAAETVFDSMTRTKRGTVRKVLPTPAEIKAEFIRQVGMTMAQAATYYHNIASGKWTR